MSDEMDTTPAGLHYRLKAVERGQEEMKEMILNVPALTAAKMAPMFPSKKECEARHSETMGVSWGKVLPPLFVLLTVILWGLFGFPGAPPIMGSPLPVPVVAPK